MNNDEWTKGIEAWEKVKRQAQLDAEQADLYIEAIKERIQEINEVN
jgi:hypothetical protein